MSSGAVVYWILELKQVTTQPVTEPSFWKPLKFKNHLKSEMRIEPFSEMRLFSSLSHFCSLNLISFSEGNWRRRCFELLARVTLWSLVTLGGCAMRMEAYK